MRTQQTVFWLASITLIALPKALAADKSQDSSSGPPIYVYILIAVGVVVIIVFLVGIFFLTRYLFADEYSLRRKLSVRAQKRAKNNCTTTKTTITENISEENLEDMDDQSAVQFSMEQSVESDKVVARRKESKPPDPRVLFVNEFCERGVKVIIEEFSQLQKIDYSSIKIEAFSKNPTLNRYANISCMDATRVKLKGQNNDYIHANYISVNANSQKWIATQGPKLQTIVDFWRMVVQEKPGLIVMLCPFLEDNQLKCSVYYPPKSMDEQEYGHFRIKNTGVIPAGITSSFLSGLIAEDASIFFRQDPFYVPHINWTGWKDHLAPDEADDTIELLRIAKATAKGKSIVVHCSAGIGRTGTFIALDFVQERLKQIDANSTLTMMDIIKELRCQRLHMIQTAPQYVFLHVCLIELLASEGILKKNRHHKSFITNYKKYLSKVKLKQAKAEEAVAPVTTNANKTKS